jgi:hypothetical protein
MMSMVLNLKVTLIKKSWLHIYLRCVQDTLHDEDYCGDENHHRNSNDEDGNSNDDSEDGNRKEDVEVERGDSGVEIEDGDSDLENLYIYESQVDRDSAVDSG